MLEHKDYLSSLNKARRKRNQNIDPRYLLLLLAAVILVGFCWLPSQQWESLCWE